MHQQGDGRAALPRVRRPGGGEPCQLQWLPARLPHLLHPTGYGKGEFNTYSNLVLGLVAETSLNEYILSLKIRQEYYLTKLNLIFEDTVSKWSLQKGQSMSLELSFRFITKFNFLFAF